LKITLSRSDLQKEAKFGRLLCNSQYVCINSKQHPDFCYTGEFHAGFEKMNTWEIPPGICLTLSTNGTWSLDGFRVAKGAGLAPLRFVSGAVPSVGSTWTTMRIEFVDYSVSTSVGPLNVASNVSLVGAAVGGAVLGFATGIAAIGSSWDAAEFDNVTLTATRSIPADSFLRALQPSPCSRRLILAATDRLTD
jgi:hypothetical protein